MDKMDSGKSCQVVNTRSAPIRAATTLSVQWEKCLAGLCERGEGCPGQVEFW
jgi:hypothetical protein